MKISWNSLKISIAGAKLSHLVQKDKAWDHGSMVEQVRTVAVFLKKSFYRNDPDIIKKCLINVQVCSWVFEACSVQREACSRPHWHKI